MPIYFFPNHPYAFQAGFLFLPLAESAPTIPGARVPGIGQVGGRIATPFSQQMTAGTPLLKRGAPDESGPAGAG